MTGTPCDVPLPRNVNSNAMILRANESSLLLPPRNIAFAR
jgi:hypothetical protein